jgi:hypothetical protein
MMGARSWAAVGFILDFPGKGGRAIVDEEEGHEHPESGANSLFWTK